jgi:hypothetical protein
MRALCRTPIAPTSPRLQGRPAANGCEIEVVCPCGVTFTRWVAPLLAAEDLAACVRLN